MNARRCAFSVVVPARYASSRLPGKPLADIGGRTMIERVHAQAAASGAREVVIATDDARIAAAAEQFGALVCMTRTDHGSGTERVAEVASSRRYGDDEIVVNLQCDEPLIPPSVIAQTAECLDISPDASVGTLCEPIESAAQLFDPSVVKVVCDAKGYALYFSRAPIPWNREALGQPPVRAGGPPPGEMPPGAYFRHIGIYAYRAGFLARHAASGPCELESVEALEQLRVLYRGGRIAVALARELPGPGVDTPEDLDLVREMVARG